MQKKIVSKEFIGIHPVYSTNVEGTGNYVSEGDIINKNCIVDYDYEGEIHLNLINLSDLNVIIRAGEKIIQMLPMYQPVMKEAKEYKSLDELYKNKKSERGAGGFGSSGV